eukprot:Phypoly_transcript_22601.p1 GENE.Phypoly_transcript_22601~~Phypoly_transcript_22601.p1  ORF type:complete len:158 (+),score=47.71 Phypoly_transcript_22601:123-596(+)
MEINNGSGPEGGKLAGQKREREPAPAFSLVSGDYDEDEDEDEEEVEGEEGLKSEGLYTKGKSEPPLDKKAKKEEDSEDELPPLPDSFNSVPRIRVTKSPPLVHHDRNMREDEERKKSFLVPPQIWKKQANVSTEDTSSWTTNRKKPTTKKPQAVETM